MPEQPSMEQPSQNDLMKSRTLADAEALNRGAEFENGRLDYSLEHKEEARTLMEKEMNPMHMEYDRVKKLIYEVQSNAPFKDHEIGRGMIIKMSRELGLPDENAILVAWNDWKSRNRGSQETFRQACQATLEGLQLSIGFFNKWKEEQQKKTPQSPEAPSK